MITKIQSAFSVTGIKGLVFDLDGTLLDTLDDLTAAVNVAMRTVGAPIRDRAWVRATVGHGIANLVQNALGAAYQTQFDEAFAAFKTYYALHCRDATRPYDGILPMLDTLLAEGYTLAVVSNKADFAVQELVRAHFGNRFAAIVGERPDLARKPAPDMALKALEEIGLTAADTLFIGDSETDIATAQNAGIPCVSCLWGFRDRDRLEAAGAACLISQPSELPSLLHQTKVLPNGIRAALFDFDGTLVDSMPYWSEKMFRVLREYGITPPENLLNIITPLGDRGTARYFREKLGVNLTEEEMVSQMDGFALGKYRDEIPGKEYVREFLELLRERGIACYVLTASPARMFRPCLQRLGLLSRFTEAWSCEDFGTVKSDPAIYAAAAERMGVAKNEVLFFDDNLEALTTAHGAGVRTVGVYDATSACNAESIRRVSDTYIHSFSEFI